MPHTKDNHLVTVDDILFLPCRVKAVHAAVEYCNVDVVTVEPMPPYETGAAFSTINTRQFLFDRNWAEIEEIEEIEAKVAPQSDAGFLE